MKPVFARAPLGALLLGACASGRAARNEELSHAARMALFQELWQTARDEFYDPGMNGVDWEAAHERALPSIERARTRAGFAQAINALLGELRASHTEYLTVEDPRYYDLVDIFWDSLDEQRRKLAFPEGRPQPAGIGILTEELAGEVFVRGVLEGSPAAAAGIALGDRIVAVEGQPFQPVLSFAGRAGRPTRLTLQREREPAPAMELELVPEAVAPRELWLRALRASARVIERGALRLGYVHVWSYAGTEVQETRREQLFEGELRSADGLVLDLRDGYGGADPEYLNLFARDLPTLALIDRSGHEESLARSWTKPVVLLVDERTTSGKEVFAHGFQARRRGPIVGARTAGAVLGGRAFLMRDGSLLYLAVRDVRVDGLRLEGQGVTPDIALARELGYAAGRDPRLERARQVLAAEIAGAR